MKEKDSQDICKKCRLVDLVCDREDWLFARIGCQACIIYDKPESAAEMREYMRRIMASEGVDFLAVIIRNGWAGTEKEAREYLESLGIRTNED